VPDAYLRRIVDDELDELLPHLSALALEGAKGVGKTATARRRVATAHRLDDRGEREIIEAEPSRLTVGPRPILIDEWQRLPDSWDVVRRAVDDGAAPGSFLLTGSPPAPGMTTHSGAGRIVLTRMRPFSLVERGCGPAAVSLREVLRGGRPRVAGTTPLSLHDYVREIVRSGLPGFRDLPERSLRTQLDGYLERIVDRDFPEAGHMIRNPRGLRRWLAAYAAASATSASFEAIRDAATGGEGEKPSRRATLPYRDVLERLHILDPLPGWLPTRNRLAHLGAASKHHLVDPALAARLLCVGEDALLAGRGRGVAGRSEGVLLGALFESLVTQSVRVYAQACEARVSHLRTHRGAHEVDLILETQDGGILAIEVKLGSAVGDGDVRHLHWLARQLGPELRDAMIITTGREAYRRADGVAVVPAALLGP
jgi:uncharacterized protein